MSESPVQNAAITPVPVPGQGGWVPPSWLPAVSGIVATVVTAVAEALSLPNPSPALVIGAGVKALVLGLVAFFGMKSAGPRSP